MQDLSWREISRSQSFIQPAPFLTESYFSSLVEWMEANGSVTSKSSTSKSVRCTILRIRTWTILRSPWSVLQCQQNSLTLLVWLFAVRIWKDRPYCVSFLPKTKSGLQQVTILLALRGSPLSQSSCLQEMPVNQCRCCWWVVWTISTRNQDGATPVSMI